MEEFAISTVLRKRDAVVKGAQTLSKREEYAIGTVRGSRCRFSSIFNSKLIISSKHENSEATGGNFRDK